MEDEELAIDEALNGGPRAETYRLTINYLKQTIESIDKDLARLDYPEVRKPLLSKRKSMELALKEAREELAVAEFVENSVRAASRRAKLDVEQD